MNADGELLGRGAVAARRATELSVPLHSSGERCGLRGCWCTWDAASEREEWEEWEEWGALLCQLELVELGISALGRNALRGTKAESELREAVEPKPKVNAAGEAAEAEAEAVEEKKDDKDLALTAKNCWREGNGAPLRAAAVAAASSRLVGGGEGFAAFLRSLEPPEWERELELELDGCDGDADGGDGAEVAVAVAVAGVFAEMTGELCTIEAEAEEKADVTEMAACVACGCVWGTVARAV